MINDDLDIDQYLNYVPEHGGGIDQSQQSKTFVSKAKLLLGVL